MFVEECVCLLRNVSVCQGVLEFVLEFVVLSKMFFICKGVCLFA